MECQISKYRYPDMEIFLNTFKILPSLKTFIMTSDMCKPTERVVSESEPLPNSSVKDLWIRLNTLNSLEIIDIYFLRLTKIHISSTGRIDMVCKILSVYFRPEIDLLSYVQVLLIRVSLIHFPKKILIFNLNLVCFSNKFVQP